MPSGPANVADITKTSELLHDKETQVQADAGYTGVEKRPEIVALDRKLDWQIAGKRGANKALAEGPWKEAIKAAVRAFVEHPFHIVKNFFRYRKVRYRGLAKNGHRLHTLFPLANGMIGARRSGAGPWGAHGKGPARRPRALSAGPDLTPHRAEGKVLPCPSSVSRCITSPRVESGPTPGRQKRRSPRIFAKLLSARTSRPRSGSCGASIRSPGSRAMQPDPAG